MTKEIILNYLTTHKKEFQQKYETEKIGLFGSYARNEAKEDSDIDIFDSFPLSKWECINTLQ